MNAGFTRNAEELAKFQQVFAALRARSAEYIAKDAIAKAMRDSHMGWPVIRGQS